MYSGVLNFGCFEFFPFNCSLRSGVYSLIGAGAQLAGSAVIISYLIGAVACVLTGLVYCEFATRVPQAGLLEKGEKI